MVRFMLINFPKASVLASLSFFSLHAFAGDSVSYVSFDEIDSNNKVLYSSSLLISDSAARMATVNHTSYLVKECSSNNGKVTERLYGKKFSDGFDISFSDGVVKKVKIIEYKIDDSKYSSYNAAEHCFGNEVVQLKREYLTELNLRDGEVKVIESAYGGKLQLKVQL